MKTITGRVEEVRQQISDSETKLAGLNKELTQHSEELEAVKNEADAQEREEGMCMQCTLHCTSQMPVKNIDAYNSARFLPARR